MVNVKFSEIADGGNVQVTNDKILAVRGGNADVLVSLPQPIGISAGTNSTSGSTVNFSNANGLSFGMNVNAVITGSYTVPTQSNQTLGLYGVGNTTQNSSTTLDARTLSFDGLGGVSVGFSNGSVQISGQQSVAQTNQTLGLFAISNTTGQSSSTTIDARSLSFEGAGGVSVGYSGGSVVISGATPTGGGGVAISAGTNSTSTGTVVFSNSNGISFGMDTNAVVTGTVKTDYQSSNANYLTSQSNQAFSASGGSSAFQTLSFSNANGATFSNNAGQVQLSYTVPTLTNSSWTVSDSATSGTVARLAFTNLNGVTLSLSTGAGGSHTIVGSHNALTSQSNQNVTAGNGGFAFQTLSFSNVNGVSFGTSAGSAITASIATQSNQTLGLYAVGNTTQNSSTTLDARTLSFDFLGAATGGYSNGSIQVSAPVQTNQTLGLYAISNTTGASSSSTVDARSFSIEGAGIASVGLTNGTFVVSVPAQGATGAFSAGVSNLGNTGGLTGTVSNLIVFAGGNNITLSQTAILGSATISIIGGAGGGAFSAGMSNLGNTAGTSGTVGSQIVFAGTNHINLSQSVNGQSATISINELPVKRTIWPAAQMNQISTNINGSQSIQYFPCPAYLSATRLDVFGSVAAAAAAASNSTNGCVFSVYAGVYTNNNGTLSSLSTGSSAYTTATFTSNGTSIANGPRLISCPLTVNMTPGDYFIMFNMITRLGTTNSVGANGTLTQTASLAITMYGGSQLSTANGFQDFGIATNAGQNAYSGMGVLSVTTNAIQDTIALSDIVATGATFGRANIAIQLRG